MDVSYVWKGCISKVRHASEESVKRALERQSEFSDRIAYYKCDICKGWHLTSKRRNKK